jgi:hypothetical protein
VGEDVVTCSTKEFETTHGAKEAGAAYGMEETKATRGAVEAMAGATHMARQVEGDNDA